MSRSNKISKAIDNVSGRKDYIFKTYNNLLG